MKPSLTIVRMFSVINWHHISVICHRSAHSEKITIKTQKQNSFFVCVNLDMMVCLWIYMVIQRPYIANMSMSLRYNDSSGIIAISI